MELVVPSPHLPPGVGVVGVHIADLAANAALGGPAVGVDMEAVARSLSGHHTRTAGGGTPVPVPLSVAVPLHTPDVGVVQVRDTAASAYRAIPLRVERMGSVALRPARDHAGTVGVGALPPVVGFVAGPALSAPGVGVTRIHRPGPAADIAFPVPGVVVAVVAVALRPAGHQRTAVWVSTAVPVVIVVCRPIRAPAVDVCLLRPGRQRDKAQGQ